MELFEERAQRLGTALCGVVPPAPSHIAQLQVKIEAEIFENVGIGKAWILPYNAILCPMSPEPPETQDCRSISPLHCGKAGTLHLY